MIHLVHCSVTWPVHLTFVLLPNSCPPILHHPPAVNKFRRHPTLCCRNSDASLGDHGQHPFSARRNGAAENVRRSRHGLQSVRVGDKEGRGVLEATLNLQRTRGPKFHAKICVLSMRAPRDSDVVCRVPLRHLTCPFCDPFTLGLELKPSQYWNGPNNTRHGALPSC